MGQGWFYLRNDGPGLPAYSGKVLTQKGMSWGWGVSPPERKARLREHLAALAKLVSAGLNAAAVIANFHRQRVVPLMQRSLPIYALTEKASPVGSRMKKDLLPQAYALTRARSAVDTQKVVCDEGVVWRLPMRPAEGYLRLVSHRFFSHCGMRLILPSCVCRRSLGWLPGAVPAGVLTEVDPGTSWPSRYAHSAG